MPSVSSLAASSSLPVHSAKVQHKALSSSIPILSPQSTYSNYSIFPKKYQLIYEITSYYIYTLYIVPLSAPPEVVPVVNKIPLLSNRSQGEQVVPLSKAGALLAPEQVVPVVNKEHRETNHTSSNDVADMKRTTLSVSYSNDTPTIKINDLVNNNKRETMAPAIASKTSSSTTVHPAPFIDNQIPLPANPTELSKWIIRPTKGDKIAVEGIRKQDGVLCHTTPVSQSISPHIVMTTSGSVYKLVGHIDVERCLENGIPKVCHS